MSLVAGLDTATSDVAVAVIRDRETIAERQVPAPSGERPRHATDLLAELESVVAEAGGWQRVDVIAAGVGPGSFTGLRIGLATARALAQALAKPVVPVVTLAALARGIGEDAGAGAQPRLAVLDARRGQAFAGLYGPADEELWPPFVATPDELTERVAALPQPPLIAGSGAIRFRGELEAVGADVLSDAAPAHRVSARHICLLAEGRSPARPESLEPIYLRPPDAELWLERDTR